MRDIVFSGKKTYGEFLKSEEGFATNILAARLASLEDAGILKKVPHPEDKRKDCYQLTEKGIDIIPVLLEIAAWSAKYDSKSEARKRKEFATRLKNDSKKVSEEIKVIVRNGGSIFPS